MTTVAEISGRGEQLQELVKQVQNGGEVVLTAGNQPVAKLVGIKHSVPVEKPGESSWDLPTFPKLKAIAPLPTRAEIAEEMFNRE